jgi:hypothetical protein
VVCCKRDLIGMHLGRLLLAHRVFRVPSGEEVHLNATRVGGRIDGRGWWGIEVLRAERQPGSVAGLPPVEW